jgi:hypothetical protein
MKNIALAVFAIAFVGLVTAGPLVATKYANHSGAASAGSLAYSDHTD